jgi:hypothetical protein
MVPMIWKDSRTTALPPVICVADVDTRLACSTFCAVCPHYVRDRRIDERRDWPRRSHDRRVLARI